MTTISWVILTYNRGDIVKRSFEHNVCCAGATWDEIIWVDNGSGREEMDKFPLMNADVAILNATNLGVAKGYNRGMGLATKDYIVITGCDMLMPDNWLKTFKSYVQEIPETGVACMYSHNLENCPERIYGPEKTVKGKQIIPAMPIERRIFPRHLLSSVGYFPEDLGFYGFDDYCWARRCERICTDKGLLTYVIPGQKATHLGTEGISGYDGKDSKEYHDFKRKEVTDPAKQLVILERMRSGWPKFSPFL